MALLEEQFTETLDAGAPDITYEGNEGKEQQVAQELWDKLPPQVRMQFGNFSQFFSVFNGVYLTSLFLPFFTVFDCF